jgi:hypothetical protein
MQVKNQEIIKNLVTLLTISEEMSNSKDSSCKFNAFFSTVQSELETIGNLLDQVRNDYIEQVKDGTIQNVCQSLLEISNVNLNINYSQENVALSDEFNVNYNTETVDSSLFLTDLSELN